MTIKCPYCKNEVRVYAGKLMEYEADIRYRFPLTCVGSGKYIDKARELNEAHERTRQTVGRIR